MNDEDWNEHIRKILGRRGLTVEDVPDWSKVVGIYRKAYLSMIKKTDSFDAAYVNASEVIIEYLRDVIVQSF